MGEKRYEIKDHLGNVRAVVSDIKNADDYNLTVSSWRFLADIKSLNNYYPYGLKIDKGSWSASNYQFAYNGKQEEPFNKNFLNFGARIYSSQLGRFLSTDDKAHLNPEFNSYRIGFNNPIKFKDEDGNYESSAGFYLELDNRLYLEGKLTSSQLKERREARAYGALIGTAIAIPMLAPTASSSLLMSGMSWMASPTNQLMMWETASLTANMLWPGGDDPLPTPGPGGELGKAIKNIFRNVNVGSLFKSARITEINVLFRGKSDKVAIIGESMDRVNEVKNVIGGNVKVETFEPSKKAKRELRKLKEELGRDLFPEEFKETRMFKENNKWIKDIKEDGVPILDIGIDKNRKNGRSESYQMEKEVVTGESSGNK